MGHEIITYTHDVGTSKIEMNRIAHETAIYRSDSRSELPSDIRFIDVVCKDIKEAEAKIESLDDGWYDQLAVKYYEYKKVKETRKIEQLRERISREETSLKKYKEDNHLSNRKSDFVGCTGCGSKVHKKYIDKDNWNYNCCPLCRTNLSSNTLKESLEKKSDNIEQLTERLAKEIDANNKKGKPTLKWLVKTEFHV